MMHDHSYQGNQIGTNILASFFPLCLLHQAWKVVHELAGIDSLLIIEVLLLLLFGLLLFFFLLDVSILCLILLSLSQIYLSFFNF